MTSVLGHLVNYDFDERYKKWHSVDPRELFSAPVLSMITDDKRAISDNISQQARYAQKLFIWTDCDREGENIGFEVANVAKLANRGLKDTDIARAVFNNVEASHVRHAADHPGQLDMRQVKAVEARSEIDLRIGAAFTRFQTLMLQNRFSELNKKVISYGSCQFPTLGFVVDQYKRVKNFKPEKFWSLVIEVKIPDYLIPEEEPERTKTGRIKKKQPQKADRLKFTWDRNHLFDHLATTVIYEKCSDSGYRALVESVKEKPTSKWRPLPLTTVELQKLGAQYFGMSSKKIMDIAENLYNKGFISYPRTETDIFDESINLEPLVEKQYNSPEWGEYARKLLGVNGANRTFTKPRKGKHNDKAHPPIHPVMYLSPTAAANPQEYEVYKFIAKRFLACVSPDAQGFQTTVILNWSDEKFKASGLVVTERNFLDVYPYQKWTSSSVQIPTGLFRTGELIELVSTELTEGSTTKPRYLTEPELIGLMDLNGIGTDATMAEHIDTIISREYVFKTESSQVPRSRARRPASSNADTAQQDKYSTLPVFIPSTLGIALVEGYDAIGFDLSLSKPFLRKEMEESMRAIIDGRLNKQEVVSDTVRKYREVYDEANTKSAVLIQYARRYIGQASSNPLD